MEIILIISSTLYFFMIMLVFYVLLKKQNSVPFSDLPFISVIIAARNEENRIKPTLESLNKLRYPKERYEVIFVDDVSEDNTALVINSYLKNSDNWNLIRLKKKDSLLKGKKAALKKAIEQARGEFIFTTDADCIVPREWLSAMASAFNDETDMVLGHSLLIKQKGWLNKFLRFDNLFSAIVVAAPALLGFPISSVGRNMAYKKASYLKTGGYDQLSSYKSGDDVHLTELFRRNINGKIGFSLKKDSFTASLPPDSLKEVFHQQIRKNSKILKKSLPTVLLSLFLFLYHLLLVAFPFLYISQIITWFFLLAIKLFAEFITLTVAARKFADTAIIPHIPVMQIFYPFYVATLGIIGLFQKYKWKN